MFRHRCWKQGLKSAHFNCHLIKLYLQSKVWERRCILNFHGQELIWKSNLVIWSLPRHFPCRRLMLDGFLTPQQFLQEVNCVLHRISSRNGSEDAFLTSIFTLLDLKLAFCARIVMLQTLLAAIRSIITAFSTFSKPAWTEIGSQLPEIGPNTRFWPLFSPFWT